MLYSLGSLTWDRRGLPMAPICNGNTDHFFEYTYDLRERRDTARPEVFQSRLSHNVSIEPLGVSLYLSFLVKNTNYGQVPCRGWWCRTRGSSFFKRKYI